MSEDNCHEANNQFQDKNQQQEYGVLENSDDKEKTSLETLFFFLIISLSPYNFKTSLETKILKL